VDEIQCAYEDLDAVVSRMAELLANVTGQEVKVNAAVERVREHLRQLGEDMKERPEVLAPAARRRATAGTSVTADPASVFLVRVRNGDPTAVALQQILDRVGLKVADGSQDHKMDGTVRCLTTLEAIYVRDANLVERALRVIVDAWHGNFVSLRADFVGGVAAFLADAGEIDEGELSRGMSAFTPKDILDATTGPRRRKLAAFLADLYTR
jgi:hypothetical protein